MTAFSHPSGATAGRARASVSLGLALAALVAFVHQAAALINPKFTPVDLVVGSERICQLKLAPIVDGKVQATVSRTLKGADDAKSLILDISKPLKKDDIQAFETAMKDRDNAAECLFFVGPAAATDATTAEGVQAGMAYMHMDGVWIIFATQPDGAWRMLEYKNGPMMGTWRGATDMLARAVAYVLDDPAAEFPVREGVAFDGGFPFAQLDGRVNACAPIDLDGDGTWTLFVAGDTGDKFFSYDPAQKNMKDVTASHAMASKSKVFAWGDFTAHGKLDLASSDGNVVNIFAQTAEGKLEAGPKLDADTIKEQVVSLAVAATGNGNVAGILIGTPSRVLLWTPRDNAAPLTVISDGSLAKDLGKAGRCLVADFDGDNIADIVQCFEKGAILCKGKAVGSFAQPRLIEIAMGSEPGDAFVGDFDAKGSLDIVTVSADACRIWQNQGGFNFRESRMQSGEAEYKAAGGAVTGMACDFNNDGRQDFVLFYSTPMNPQLFFNRGFRSFAFAGDLDTDLTRSLPKDPQGRPQGQQGGCMADFNGDGAQDLIVILNSGQCWFFPMASGGDALAVRAALPPGSYAGPLTVTGWREGRCLGAWNVLPGCAEAFVAWKEPGPLSIKWQVPGSPPQSKTIVLENKARRLLLTTDSK